MANKIPSLDLWMEPVDLGTNNYLQKNHNWSVLKQYGVSLSDYVLAQIKSYDDRFNQQMQNAPQPSEVVDARIDSWGKPWGTLKARIDNDEQATPRILDLNQDSDATSVLYIRDLSTSSTKFSLQIIKNVASITLPVMGYASTTVANLGFDVVG